MTGQTFSPGTEQKLARLIQRVDHTIESRQKFDEMASALSAWARRWPTAALARWLTVDDLPTGDREIALVALALQATREAGEAIAGYDGGERGEEHRLFTTLVRQEWKRRYDGESRRRAS